MTENVIDTSLLISIISIVLAVLALGWNILNATLLDRGRLDVSIDFGMQLVGGSPGTDRTVVTVSATNIGRRPVWLTGLWLAFGGPPPWWRHFVPQQWQGRFLSNINLLVPFGDPMLAARSSTLPVMLGVAEVVTIYDYEQGRVFDRAREKGFTHAHARAWGSTASGWSKKIKIPFPQE